MPRAHLALFIAVLAAAAGLAALGARSIASQRVLLEQAAAEGERLAAEGAAVRVREALDGACGPLLAALPEGGEALDEALAAAEKKDSVAAAFRLDRGGRLAWPPLPQRTGVRELDQEGDEAAREDLQTGYAHEFRGGGAATAIPFYVRSTSALYGRPVRAEAALQLAAALVKIGKLDEAIPAYGLALELRSVLEPERWAAAWAERARLLWERGNSAGAEHEVLVLARLLWGEEGLAMGALGDGARRKVERLRAERELTAAGQAEMDRLIARSAADGRRQVVREEAADAAAAPARAGATMAATAAGLVAWKPVRNGGVAGVVLKPEALPPVALAGPAWSVARDGVTAPLPGAVGLSARIERKNEAAAAIRRQRLLWGSGLAVLVAALGAGLLLAFRAVRREGELARLKSDFVAQVSHELKTPLSLVRMYAETLAMGRVAEPEKRAEYLAVIVRESERLTGMLEKILDFSRLEKGERAFERKLGDLAVAARAAAEAFAAQGGPRVAVEAPAKVLASFDADGVALALRNLLENAARYSEGAPDIRVVVEAPGRIHVDDRGIGVAPADRERLFTRFFRSDDPRVRRVKGTGLGLALVAHVMAGHDGAATAAPRVGGGTRFTLSFPGRANGTDDSGR